MVYDEDSDEFKPRYGYKRTKNGIEDIPIVEIKTGQVCKNYIDIINFYFLGFFQLFSFWSIDGILLK